MGKTERDAGIIASDLWDYAIYCDYGEFEKRVADALSAPAEQMGEAVTPIAWLVRWPNGQFDLFADESDALDEAGKFRATPEPLYLAPPTVALTLTWQEVEKATAEAVKTQHPHASPSWLFAFARALLASAAQAQGVTDAARDVSPERLAKALEKQRCQQFECAYRRGALHPRRNRAHRPRC